MTTHQTIGSACAETSKRRTRRLAAGGLALTAMLLPLGAWGMDTSPKLHFDKAGNLLPLPPIPYLDSMRWMDWKPSAPLFKTDTLLLPDSAQPGFFRIPWDYERALPRMT
jgi:hypothetical protein